MLAEESELLTRLGDVAWQVRKQAVVETIDYVRAGSEDLSALELGLLEALVQGENVGLRGAAVEVLGHLGPRATPWLTRAYEQLAPNARKFVVHALGEGGDPNALPTLSSALECDDVNCRAAAIEAVARIGGPAAVDSLVARLSAGENFEIMAALDGLNRLEARLPYISLEPLLADGLLRRGALPLLGRCADERAVEPLAAALETSSAFVAGVASRSLVHLLDANARCERAVAARMLRLHGQGRHGLLRLIEGEDPGAAADAAHLSIFARDADALPGVVRLAEEGTLSAEAMAPLLDWGRPCVLLLLAHGATQVGRQGGIALELAAEVCRDDGPVPELRFALREALTSADEARVEAAARALARWAEALDAPPLVLAARAGDDTVARACAESLAQLAKTCPHAVSSALAGATLEGGFGAAMAKVAAALPVTEAYALLATGLCASDARARKAAVEALGRLKDSAWHSEISFALADEDRAVQAAAARSMGATLTGGSADERAELVAALASPDASVRAAAATGIAGRTGGAVTAQLVNLIDDANANVAVEALLALGRIRAPELPSLARAALAHPEAERRKAGLRSLALAGSPNLFELAALKLGDEAWDVRVVAAHVLAALGSVDARASLGAQLTGELDETVRSTIEALLMAEAEESRSSR